nr:hypothetical protein [Planctomycetota bacterium]
GELIRLQVQLEGMAPDERGYSPAGKKVRDLEKTQTQFGQLPGGVSKFEHRCGFIEQIELTLTSFLKNAEDIFAHNPIQHVVLRAKSAKLAKIAELSQLANLRSLELRENQLGNAGLKTLVGAPQMRSLERLTIYSNEIDDLGIAELVNFENLAGVRELRILNNDVTDEGVAALADSAVLNRISLLEIIGAFSDETFRHLARSENFRLLENLAMASRVTRTMPTAEGLQAFGQSEFDAPLKELTLLDCISNGIGKGFADSPRLASLKKLEISWCDLGDSDAQDLVQSLPPLEVLRLEENSIGDDGARALASSPLLESLQKVYLTNNAIKVPGVKALAASLFRQKKTKFYLAGNPLDEAELKQIAEIAGKSFGNFGRPQPYWTSFR